ncbi:MAG: hypothetical protein MPEBLZ_03959 [Candidatus Methanoperedens nitroreducens]|uniref:Uncharacterized protein n=1 Tax=Candidatus Methanoperedens nitratireducens TaxID=1392998 RepID=A0A0P8CFU9_9EURY|nr:hypothetical protein [Candidatus Methanoperedens sp. BLZ2]KPQ41491.1 MAG: hypothetical protein MPEBLZ_03959 [Candidatus Methanoperedens sp. BLZ1]
MIKQFSIFQTVIKQFYIFQTGLTGSTGYSLSFDPVHPVILSRMKELQIKADKRRLIAPIHRKVGYEPRFINGHEKNNELKRTETNSSSMSSYKFVVNFCHARTRRTQSRAA